MKSILILIIQFIFICNAAFCQRTDELSKDTVNKMNKEGKESGWWIEYANKKLLPCKKSKAIFQRLVYYDNGYKLHNYCFGYGRGFGFKSSIKVIGNQPVKDSIVQMDGTYRLYNEKSKLVIEEIYMQGKIQSLRIYNPKSGNVTEYFDYTKHYNNQEGSGYLLLYNADGSINFQGYYKKDDKGKWK